MAELAILPLRQGTFLAPDLIINNVTLPFFPNRKHALIAHRYIHSADGFYCDVERVDVLQLVPVYPSEVTSINTLGSIRANRQALRAETRLSQPERSAFEFETPDPFGTLGVPSPWIETSNDELLSRLANLWASICGVTVDEMNSIRDQHQTPIGERIEEEVGVKLPPDFRLSLDFHTLKTAFAGFELLSADHIIEQWSKLTQDHDLGRFKGHYPEGCGFTIIQNQWWHRGWVPFAWRDDGFLMCVDTEASNRGYDGQVIVWSENRGPHATHDSFLHWLAEQI